MRRRATQAVLGLLSLVAVFALLAGGWTAWVELHEREPEALRVERPEGPWYVTPGETAPAAVVLKNVGSEDLTVTVWLAPLGEEASWLSVSPEMRRVTVPANQESSVDFTLVTKEGSPPGLGEAELIVAWVEDGHRFTNRQAIMVQALRAGETPPDVEGHRIRIPVSGGAVAIATATVVGAAAGGLVGALYRIDWRRFHGAVAAAFYSRINRSDALANENRRKVMEAIEEDPGIHFSALRRRTELPNGALYHHLRILETNGLVTSELQHGRRVYAPTGTRLESPEATPAERRILDALPPEGMTQTELADRLGITRQGVGYHLKNLLDRGLLRKEMAEGSWRYHRT